MSPALAVDGHHVLQLRDYQEDMIAAVEKAEAEGLRRLLGVAATGLGKTAFFCALAARRGDRTLIVAHRDELISQAAEKVRLWWPDADVGVVKAERNETWAQDAVVASVQSLTPQRIARLGRFGLVVVDEAHHATARSYTRILDTLGCGPDANCRPDDGPLLVGVTATPDRADGKGLNEAFERIVFSYDLLWGIRAGYLADVRAIEIKVANLDLGKVAVRQGDYAEGELGAELTKVNAPRHIVKAWREHASDRLTLVFMPTVANAVEVAAEFAAAGVKASAVAGSDPVDERRRKMADFSAGRIQVLVNCQVATEGFDVPAIGCVVMGRPTKSRGLFVQCIGRGTRPYPGKDDLLVLDLVGNSESHDLCSVPSLFGLTRKQMRTRRAAAVVQEIEEARRAEELRLMSERPTVPDAALVARDVELFKQVSEQGRIAWAKVGGSFAVSVGQASVVIDHKGDDLYSVIVVSGRKGSAETLMDRVPLALAQGIAEDHIRRKVPAALVNKEAAWRGRAPSPKQLEAARRLRIAVDPAWSAGQVSQAIDARLAEFRKRKAQ